MDTCDSGINSGNACITDDQCPNPDLTMDGLCTNNADVTELPSDVCSVGLNYGEPCSIDAQCPSADANCNHDNSICGADSLNVGATCGTDGDCDALVGACVAGTCSGGSNDGNSCTDDADCPGSCMGTCDAGLFSGSTCVDNSDCPVAPATCGLLTTADDYTCDSGSNKGLSCESHADCPGGSVDLTFVTGSVPVDQKIEKAYVYWGDRTRETVNDPDTQVGIPAVDPKITHDYNQSGTFSIKITTYDDDHNKVNYNSSNVTGLDVTIP
jgi:hypothetical protein